MFSHIFNLSRNAKDMCMGATIKIVIQHRQEYKDQFSRKKKPDSLSMSLVSREYGSLLSRM
jgi:hypothetical protein